MCIRDSPRRHSDWWHYPLSPILLQPVSKLHHCYLVHCGCCARTSVAPAASPRDSIHGLRYH
eukprot:5399525-Pyramimonas_sp.AAC.1